MEELHHVLTITDVVNLQKLSSVHKVSNNYGTLLIKNNLLVKTKGGAMRWTTIEPTREMAATTYRPRPNISSVRQERKFDISSDFKRYQLR